MNGSSMRSRYFASALFVAGFSACAPHVTIADGTSGAAGDGGSAAGGATGGTFGGRPSTGGASSGTTSTGNGGSTTCYVAGGRGNVAIPCGGATSAGGSAGSATCYLAGGFGPLDIACGGSATGTTCYVAGGFGNVTVPCGSSVLLPPRCAQPIDQFVSPSCDAPFELRSYCAKGGCHNPATHSGDLDLTPDEFLAARILNVPASLKVYPEDCLPPGCPTGALLIDRASPESSWMLRKMEPFIPGETTTTTDMGCGKAMPTFDTFGTQNYSPASKACLTEFFTRIALYGTPCGVVRPPPNLPPSCGGASSE